MDRAKRKGWTVTIPGGNLFLRLGTHYCVKTMVKWPYQQSPPLWLRGWALKIGSHGPTMFKIPLGVEHRFSDAVIETHGCSAVVKEHVGKERERKRTTKKDNNNWER